MSKMNGSGNHEEDEEDGASSNVSRFPTPDERREIERMKAAMKKAQEEAARGPSEPMLNLPPVVKAMSGILLLVHLVLSFVPEDIKLEVWKLCAFIPARYTVPELPLDAGAFVSPLGHMFLHGGWLHIGMNIGMFLAFGSGIEKTVGGKKLLVIYFVTGLLGVAFHMMVNPYDIHPLVGASGGISGLFGAFLIMANDRGMMGDGTGGWRKLAPVVAICALSFLLFGLVGVPGESGQIAWTVHLAGFFAGLFLFRSIDRLKI